MEKLLEQFIVEVLKDTVYKSNKDSLMLDKDGSWVEKDVRKKIGKYFADIGMIAD